jgi:hypothetical protein
MRSIRLVVCLSMLFTGAAALAQESTNASDVSNAAAAEAYVYDETGSGLYVYDASSTGKLTLVKGSPFQPTGQVVGTNGKFLLTVNDTILFSYKIESDGGIGDLVSQINTQLYSGSECSSTGISKQLVDTCQQLYA